MFRCTFNEDGSATFLAVLGADNGSGSVITGGGLGKWLQQANISSISCNVYDVTDSDTEVTPAPSITVSDVIFDTVQTDGAAWSLDDNALGYNFKATLAPTYFPTGGHVYRVEFYFTLSGGTHKLPVLFEGVARGRLAG